jgi:release factor glutamine methyltransferase
VATELLNLSPSMRRDEARRELAAALAGAGIESAELDARIFVCAGLGITHAAFIGEPGLPIGSAAKVIEAYARRRLTHEPVSRILGYRDFWDARFEITSAVLDPRPETETLVDTVLGVLKGRLQEPLWLLDLGVGSGAILAALLHSLPKSFGVGLDVSAEACAVARRNFANLGLTERSSVACGNWTAALRGSFDVIVANPPYIIRNEIGGLAREVRDYDPHLALDGGDDGLAAYRRIIPDLRRLLSPHGYAAVEIGSGQSPDVSEIFRAAGFEGLSITHDLAGHDRVVLAELSAKG